MDEKSKRNPPKASQMGLGIAIGVALGVGIGVALDNIAIGLAVGVAVGAAIGTSLEQKRRPDDTSNDDLPRGEPPTQGV